MDSALIGADDTAVVRNAADRSAFIVRLGGETKIGKSRVNLRDTVGLPYASYFELNGRRFQRSEDVQEEEAAGDDPGAAGEEGGEGAAGADLSSAQMNALSDQEIASYVGDIVRKNAEAQGVRGDNSFYVDTNTAQKLSDQDILRLREEGLSGADIIKTLMKNSDTFAMKSDFAQAKWIKRKEMKYRKKYQVLRSSPASICEASFSKNRDKICGLRVDTLAQLLSQSGIHSGCHVMVIESTVGLVTGSVAYRMRGQGRILSVYGGQQAHLDIARYFNLPKECLDIVEPVPALELGPAAKHVAAQGFEDFQVFALPARPTPASAPAADEPSEAQPVQPEAQHPFAHVKKRKLEKKGGANSAANDQLSSTGRTPEALPRVRSYLRQGVDRLIIAGRYRPLPLLKVALYLLAPSSSFAVYHEFLEPLVECFLYLQDAGLALRLVLSDTWMREFQTLPGRVRPDMFMSTSGGFLLTGIYVGMVPRPFLGELGQSTAACTAEQSETS